MFLSHGTLSKQSENNLLRSCRAQIIGLIYHQDLGILSCMGKINSLSMGGPVKKTHLLRSNNINQEYFNKSLL